jgi:hypothetical protein
VQAEEKEQQWMFREAQATVSQRATSASARTDLHLMQTYHEAHQQYQMQEQANQWDQVATWLVLTRLAVRVQRDESSCES